MKSKLKIFNIVGKKKTFIRVSETDGFISQIVFWYLSDFYMLSEIIIPLKGALFW